MSALHVAAGIVVAVTAVVHSVLGERRLIAPLFTRDASALSPVLRRAIRFTWHLAALLMLLTALTIAWPGAPAMLVRIIGAVYLLLGLLSLKMTRGKHISGPLFTAGGVLALLA